jgi:Papain family cysteine protease
MRPGSGASNRRRGPKDILVRKPARLLSCIVVVLFATTTAAAGAASAATPASIQAAAIESHGLGGRLPTARVAPRVNALAVPPASADLRKWAVPPGNQGAVGSCVTWAIDYGMLGWYSRYSGRTGEPFAPMYTYSQINGGVDRGSSPIAALQVALTQGSDTRAHYTHGDYDWKTQPTASERANAARYKIKSYTTLFMGANQAGSATLIKNALATNHPVAIVMAVRHGFDILGSSPSAVDDDITSGIRGYHEVLALGYDSAGLIIENSWGTGWANGGFGRLSWRVVQNDVWEGDTIDGFAAVAPPTPPAVSTPTVALVSPAASATSTASYKVAWTATPGGSGAITRFDAWYSVDGGALVAVNLASTTALSFPIALRAGHSYRVAVRPTAGTTTGATMYSASFVPTVKAASVKP